MPKSKKNRKKKSRSALADVQDSQSSKQSIEVLFREAEAAVDSFEFNMAESKLQEILQIDSNNCKCLEMLSSIYTEKFQWQEASDLLKRCIEISPEEGYSKYFSIGQIYEGLESVTYYEKGIQILEKELENSENIEPSKELCKSATNLRRDLSNAYCSISELYMTDCCDEENAENKCSTAIDSAIKSDSSNPEAYQCLASFQLVKGQVEEAKETMKKSLSLWFPELERLREGLEEVENESENLVPLYDARIKTSKLLIELEMFYEASKILEGLLEEDDEVVEVWYLLGWLNYVQGDDYKRNAHFYLKKAKEVSVKMGIEDDEFVEDANKLLTELSSTHPLSDDDDNDNEEVDNEEDCESSFCTDSESEDEMET